MSENYLFAFGLTLLAGLSTGLGSAIALLFNKTNVKFLAFSLGLSAGVMIYVSFVELLPLGQLELGKAFGLKPGYLVGLLAFFGGIGISMILDRLMPQPHEATSVEDIERKKPSHKKLLRVGLFTAIALAIHNFPEGLATFIAALGSAKLGISIAIAIAIHNIPEGIAVAVPVYHATGDKKKAFLYSFISGLAEPVGALLGLIILMHFMTPALLGIMFCLVAGIMIYISMDELLPTAEAHGEHHLSVYGFMTGMFVMALSLYLLL